jgi:uncharacterized RDD family membrane protein YckC
VKVGDFGLSISTQARPESMLTMTGTVLGTPSFSSPEQLRGEPLDVTSDIYSVGATLYYLLTGQPPLQGREFVQLITQVLQKMPDPPHVRRPGIPRGLSRVVMRCLAKERAARFGDYASLRRALAPYTSASASPATLARRTAAGMIDAAILVVFDLIPGMMDATSNVASRTTSAWALFFAYIAANVLYFAVAEGIWGTTPGKAALGLRVVRISGDAPGFPRAMIRSLLFNANSILPGLIPMFFVSSAGFSANPERWEGTLMLAGLMLLLPMFSTMRRSNSFATVYDLLTSTRVVARPSLEARPVTEHAAVIIETERVDAGPQTRDTDVSFGPYTDARAYAEQEDHRLWLAHDPVLQRRVVIVERFSNAGDLAESRRHLSRPGRVRWLAGQRSPARAWDAFELPDGEPLHLAANSGRPWPVVRTWLRDLTTELAAGIDDPASAAVAGIDQLWITRSGRILLLDFVAPGAAPGSSNKTVSDPAGIQQFLIDVATTALEPVGEIRRTPIPLHASDLLGRLRQQSFADVHSISEALRGIGLLPATLSAGRRFASVAAPTAMIIGMAAIGWTERTVPELEPQPSVPTLGMLLEMNGELGRQAPALRNAIEVVIAGRYRELLSDSAFWSDTTVSRPILGNRSAIGAILAAHHPLPGDIANADAVITAHLPYYARNERQEGALVGILLALLAGLVVSLFVSLLFRRVSGLALLGIAVVDRSGRHASRLRLLTRSLLSWGSLLVLAVISLRAAGALQSRRPGGPIAISVMLELAPLVLPALAVMAIIAFSFLRSPDRALQDRLVRTWLVPL